MLIEFYVLLKNIFKRMDIQEFLSSYENFRLNNVPRIIMG